MGTGKTVVGNIIASQLNREFIDMDGEIEKREGSSISDIFATHGEKHFRDIETQMAKTLAMKEEVVISTGGGVVLRRENIDCFKTNGIIVCLMATPETIYNRTKDSDDRPLLKVPNPEKRIEELLSYRMPFYKNADFVIQTDGLSPYDVAWQIISLINKE